MQFRFLLNSEQKIVAAKNYTLAGISYLLRIFLRNWKQSFHRLLEKRDYSPLDIHESGWKNNKDRLSANA